MIDLNNRFYYPMIVSNTGTIDKLSHEEDALIWKKFLSMSSLKQDILTDEQVPEKIVKLQEKLQLPDSIVGIISLHIRKIFFDEVSLSDTEVNLKNVLLSNGDDVNKASAIVDFIQKEILTLKPKPKVEEVSPEEVKPQAVTVRLPLLQALSKYEQLGNQLVTRERIKIKSQPEPVRPSLLYWIKYYRDELGIGHHDSVQRGNFLFRSENGRRLSPEERERVNLVLKSVEENMPLEIDTEKSEIVFPVFEASSSVRPPQAVPQTFESAPKRAPAPASPSNPAFSFGRGSMAQGVASVPNAPAAPASLPQSGGEMSFSSKHVFPAEKQGAASRPAAPITPASSVNMPTGAQTVPRANPFRIRPVSLGQEE